jgi:hypothetical protein
VPRTVDAGRYRAGSVQHQIYWVEHLLPALDETTDAEFIHAVEDRRCRICDDRGVEVLLPCGHAVCCLECDTLLMANRLAEILDDAGKNVFPDSQMIDRKFVESRINDPNPLHRLEIGCLRCPEIAETMEKRMLPR